MSEAEQKKGRGKTLAEEALRAIDALLQSLEGGGGLRALIDARGVLASYVHGHVPPADAPLRVQQNVLGGITLVRGGQYFTLNDEEIDMVREAIAIRKRELRKKERKTAPNPTPRRYNRVR